MNLKINDNVKCTCTDCFEYKKEGTIVDMLTPSLYDVQWFDGGSSYMVEEELLCI